MAAGPPNIMTLFTTMYSYVETAIATSVASFGAGLVSFVAAPLALAAIIYFLLLGFAVLRGAIQAPLREDRKSTRLNSSHIQKSRMPSSA